jgi:hypothetical protein
VLFRRRRLRSGAAFSNPLTKRVGTRLVPSLPFAKRTAPVSGYSASNSFPISCGFFRVFRYSFELVRAMTSRPGRFVSFPRTSSVMPSAKWSSSFEPRFSNGRTAFSCNLCLRPFRRSSPASRSTSKVPKRFRVVTASLASALGQTSCQDADPSALPVPINASRSATCWYTYSSPPNQCWCIDPQGTGDADCAASHTTAATKRLTGATGIPGPKGQTNQWRTRLCCQFLRGSTAIR